jgi:hypothetical protein
MMVRVQLEAPPPTGTALLDAAGKPAGVLTSVATLPGSGANLAAIGLAVVKTAAADAGEQLYATTDDDRRVAVSVIAPAGVYEPVR